MLISRRIAIIPCPKFSANILPNCPKLRRNGFEAEPSASTECVDIATNCSMKEYARKAGCSVKKAGNICFFRWLYLDTCAIYYLPSVALYGAACGNFARNPHQPR